MTQTLSNQTFLSLNKAENGLPETLQKNTVTVLFKRLIREEVWRHKLILFMAVLCMIMAAFSTSMSAYLIDPAIKNIFLEKDESTLIWLPLLVIAVSFVRGISLFAQASLMGTLGQKVVSHLQERMFRSLVYVDMEWLQKNHTSTIVNRFMTDAFAVREAASNMLVVVVRDILSIIGLAGVMIYQDWKLACIALFVLLPLALGVKRLTKKVRKTSKAIFEQTSELSVYITEALAGTRMVRIYNQEEYEINKSSVSIIKRLKYLRKAIMTRALSSPLTETLTGVGFAAAIFYAGHQGLDGRMDLAQFMSFVTAMMMAYQPGRSLSNMVGNLQTAVEAMERIFEIIDLKPRIKEKTDAKVLEKATGHLVFENVHFSYDADKKALSNLSLEIQAGQTVALVGPSGGGKSTLMNMIPRFYDTLSGKITLDGHDIRDLTLHSLREQISLVSQDPFLFDGSIRENIIYGNRQASDDQIIKALKDAAAYDFVMALPEKLETLVGQGGNRLSGGQKQRLVIARAMIKDAPILLLDEATSALDTQSEIQIRKALDTLMKHRTTIMIAHRLSTVINADQIFVIDGGHLVEQGTHAQLMEKEGLYAILFKANLQDELEPIMGEYIEENLSVL